MADNFRTGERSDPRLARLPAVVDGCGQVSLEAATPDICVSAQRLIEHFGAILFTGFTDVTPLTFEQFANALSVEPALEYVYRSTPRVKVGDGVYTASEYPADRTIPMHNENAYQRDWPMRLFFCCIQRALAGGETPLASTIAVTERIPRSIRDKFDERCLMYVRNYHVGVDLPWQTVFQTEDASEVERYCRLNDIQFEWRPDGGLRTKQVCRAMATHPRAGVRVWFNQAHLFHPSSLSRESREAMREIFDEQDFPRQVYFGDGTPLPESDLEEIREAFRSETIVFPWREGDILALDNMLVSHGRLPYQGPRKILAALRDRYSTSMTSRPGLSG